MSAMALAAAGWQTPSPAVYLDQWVWIRFARVLQGSPQEASDEAAFATAAAAARRGIQFPLSTTHYEETLRITNHRQRRDLVNVMAPITNMCTLRKQGDLVRHQLLVALHETVGRPTFRPTSPWVLRRGVSWAFQGVERELRVLSPDGNIQPVDPAWLKQVWQWFEAEMLAGPAADDLPVLHTSGYISPRELETPGNRLEWEQDFAKHLAELSPRPPRAELRIWFLARELMHEYMDDLGRVAKGFGRSG